MRTIFVMLLIFVLTACTSTAKAPSAAAAPTPWKEKSNAVARDFALGQAERYPEAASGLGYREFDAKAIQLEDDMESKDEAYIAQWQMRLEALLATEPDEELRTDYRVLASQLALEKESAELDKKYPPVGYCQGTKTVFVNLQSVINAQSSPERKKAGVDRFKAYVNGHGVFRPFLEACVSRSRHLAEQAKDKKPFYPFRTEVREYLTQSKSYLVGIQELLQSSGRSDWQEDFAKFRLQAGKHDEFVEREILPKARKDFRLPRERYAFKLKAFGIPVAPEDLIAMAEKDYKETFAEFKRLAAEIAPAANLKSTKPAAVIARLKRDQVTKPDEVMKLYENASERLNMSINARRLVSLPATPLKIRFAGDAESKASPVPHLQPPPLIGNQGERPEFVVPTSSTGKLPFDDFSYPAAAILLTAHEGRPGHDLQFSSMLDNGVSVIRARYAANSVNIEGWGLYAEDLMYPSFDKLSQFVALQTRLWRIARAFLEPQIQLGKISQDRVIELFTKELGVSEAMAKLEARRYTYESIGQAPSYYYGRMKLLEAKAETKARLGEKFKEMCFNDAVLEMGLLPVDIIAQRLKTLECK